MLSRLSTHVKLTLLALALVIVPGALVVMGQSGWALQRLQEVITRQLAEATKREVSVGPISGNLLTNITIDGLAIAEQTHLADGAVVSVDRVQINYDLLAVLRGRLASIASVRSVRLYNARLHLVRTPDGRLNLQQLLPPAKITPVAKRFRGRLYLHDAAVLYEDYSRYVKVQPLKLQVADLNMSADARKITRIVTDSTARVTDGHASGFAGRVIIDSIDQFVDVSGSITGIDAAWFMRTFGLQHGYTITGGRADVEGCAFRVPRPGRKPVIDFSGSGQLHGVTASAPGLPYPLRLDGEAWGSLQGFKLRRMTASLAGSQYALTGYMTQSRTPVVDLFAASDHVQLAPLLRLAPKSLGKAALAASGPASVRLTIIGPVNNPDLRAQVGMEQPVSLRLSELGTVQARGLRVSADVVAAARPSVRATVSGSALSLPRLKIATGTNAWPREVRLSPLQAFSTSLWWCGGAPAAEAELRVPLLMADRLRVTNLRARGTLLKDLVRLRNVSAQALGGKLAADIALGLKGPARGLQARGSLRGINLARLQELPLRLKETLTGSANATFEGQATARGMSGAVTLDVANVHGKDLSVGAASATLGLERTDVWRGAGLVAARAISVKQVEASRAEGLLQLQGDQLIVHSAFFESQAGLGWGHGEVSLKDHTLDLQVRGAELSVSRLTPLMGLKDLKGTAYASGTVTGTTAHPNFQGKLIVFTPQVQDYALDALTADVRVQGDGLEVKDFQASRGRGIVSGHGTVDHLGAAAEQMAVQAEIQGEGIRLFEVAKLAKKDWPADGLGEFTASVSGSMAHPQARGVIRVSNARYEDIPISRAQLPFTVDQQRLTVSALEAQVLDAPLTGRLTVEFGKPAHLEASLSAGEVRLQGLSPFWKSGVPLGGTATVHNLWVRGPTDNLQGGAQITAPEVSLGGETIRDVDAKVSLAKGQVQLQETSFGAAGGRVGVKAAYDYASDPRTAAAEVSLLGTNASDLLYLAIPITQAVDTRPAEKQANLKLALRSYALRLRGVVEGTLKLSGPINSPAAMASLKGQQLVLDGRDFPDVTAQGSVTATGIQGMAVALRQGDSLVTVDGDLVFDGPINANVEGSGINLAQLRPWLPPAAALEVPFGGRLGFTVVASGQTRHPDLMASVDVLNPNYAGVQFDVLSVPIATVREGQIDVDTLVIKRGEQQIIVDGQLPFSWSLPRENGAASERRPGLIPTGQVTLNGRIDQTELAFFLPLLDEYLRSRKQTPTSAPTAPFQWTTIEAKGKVDSSVSVTGTVEDPTLRGFLRVADGSLKPASWKHPLEGLGMDVALTGTGRDNLVEVRALKAAYDQTKAELAGRVSLDYLSAADFWRNRFDLTAKGTAVDQGMPGGLHLTNLTGGLALHTKDGKQVVTAEGLAFGLGAARAALTGSATLSDFRLANLANNQFDLALNVTPGRIVYANLVNAVVGGKLQLVTPAGRTRALLKGDWQVSEGMIGLAPGGQAGAAKALSSRFPSPDLDITAGLGKSLVFRGSGTTAPLDPNPTAVRVAGTPQHPILSGNVMARGGQTSLPTATLRLSYLGVNYTVEPIPGDRDDPVGLRTRGSVQGLAETTINRKGDSPIRISVNISGALPDQVVVQASSNPALSETQIYALLGGIPFAQLPGIGGRDANLTQMVSEQFLASLANAFRLRVFQPIEEELKRALGLSELGITFAFDQPVSVQIGKYVLRNFLVSYERPLTSDVQRYDLRVSYELPGGLRISYHNDERNDQRVEVGYNFTF